MPILGVRPYRGAPLSSGFAQFWLRMWADKSICVGPTSQKYLPRKRGAGLQRTEFPLSASQSFNFLAESESPCQCWRVPLACF